MNLIHKFLAEDFPVQVNIVLAILSFILALFSLLFVIFTLKQNQKILTASTRPYLTISVDATYFKNITCYLVIKNAGASAAILDDITYDDSIRSNHWKNIKAHELIDSLKGVTFAPNQKFLIPITLHTEDKSVCFNLIYRIPNQRKYFKESFNIPLSNYSKLVTQRIETDDKLKDISFALQEIAQRTL